MNKVEKYVVVLLEEPKSLVILKLSYSYDDDKLPALSLVKQSNKIPIDCICPCILPASEEQDHVPSFWITNENYIQLIQIDPSKPQKILPSKTQKYNFAQFKEGQQSKCTTIRQSYLTSTTYDQGEDIELVNCYIAVATSDT